MAKEKRIAQRQEETATEKQLAFMDKLGIVHDEKMSKAEASKVIDEALKKE